MRCAFLTANFFQETVPTVRGGDCSILALLPPDVDAKLLLLMTFGAAHRFRPTPDGPAELGVAAPRSSLIGSPHDGRKYLSNPDSKHVT